MRRVGGAIAGALGRLLDRALRWSFDPPAVQVAYAIVYDGTAPAETHVIGPGR